MFQHVSTDGSVVEFSPATREARVRFPVSAPLFFFAFLKNNIYKPCHKFTTSGSCDNYVITKALMVQW